MSQENQITLRGFVTKEPTLRQTVLTATPVAEIRVGCTPRRLNRDTGEWQDAPTSYFTVKCWRRLAVNARSSLHKGDMVVIRGRFYTNNWIDNQQRPRSAIEIEADSVGHDLAYGWSTFLRGTSTLPGSQAGVNAGESARQDLGPSNPDNSDDEYSVSGDSGDSGDSGESQEQEGATAPLAPLIPITESKDDASPPEPDREKDAVPF
jgi:single-strand DNA-binding protein